MKNLNVSQPLSGVFPGSRLHAAKAMAFTLALADPDLPEPRFEDCSGSSANIRDDMGNEMICRMGGEACMPLDEWAGQLA